jgi:hypothetical protein
MRRQEQTHRVEDCNRIQNIKPADHFCLCLSAFVITRHSSLHLRLKFFFYLSGSFSRLDFVAR